MERHPDPGLKRRLIRELPALDGADWVKLTGGRTNLVWRIDAAAPMVCKQILGPGPSVLFPNDPEAEIAVMRHVAPMGLSPQIVRVLTGDFGTALIYPYQAGDIADGPRAATARALARLHALETDALTTLRSKPGGAALVLAEGDAILRRVNQPGPLAVLRPTADVPPSHHRVLLHGDPVPANAICRDDETLFIDWQCPAIGDPTEDLAIALSPAMNWIYARKTVSSADEAAFLSAYGNGETTARYAQMKACYAYRMAAHCLVRAEAGDQDYFEGYALELATLEEARQQ